MYTFIRTATAKSNSLLNTELSDTDFQPFIDIMNFFIVQLGYIQTALKAAFMYDFAPRSE